MTTPAPAPGSRIRYAGAVGTVRYLGPVHNTPGNWLGVEWDDPKRGKHDGVKDGKRYFSCRYPTAGSFIRPSSNVQCGVSFLQALSEKYIEQLHGEETQETVVLGSSLGAIQVEIVGLDKVRTKLSRLERLKLASLDGTLVAHPDAKGKIKDTCPNIRGLNLSFTLVSSWATIVQIAAELPVLQQLSLNKIRLLSLDFEATGAISAFPNLIELQLNGTLLTWSEAHGIIAQMPQLRSLEMGYNELTSLSGPPNGSHMHHSHLQILNFDNNKLSDWAHVASSTSSLSSVQTLVVSSNTFISIRPPTPTDVLNVNIKHLSVSSNPLGTWSDLEALSQWCPSLEILSAQDIPLNEKAQCRSLVIARFPQLTRLDGTLISDREREEAEILYISQLAREGVVSSPDAVSKPFRWDELCAKHGPPEEKVTQKQEKLSSQLIEIKVAQAETLPITHTRAEEAMTVLPTMLLRSLRGKIKKLRCKGRGAVELWMKMRDNAWVELRKEDDASTLDWLGLENETHIAYHVIA